MNRGVAVLYLEDLSPTRSLGALADGLTEMLIERLSDVRSLEVVPPNGVRPYRGRRISPDSIARTLGVGTIVTGSVAEADGRYQLTVRLLDGADAGVVRDATFEMPQGDLHTLRDSVAERVARFLGARLGAHIRLQERRFETRSDEAWLLYQRAERLRTDPRSVEDPSNPADTAAHLARIDSLLEVAERLDQEWPAPTVARARVMLAEALRSQQSSRRDERIARALAHVERALSRAPSDADALAVRGRLLTEQWANLRNVDLRLAADSARLAEAEQSLLAATEIEPAHAEAWYWLSIVQRHAQDFARSLISAERAYHADIHAEHGARLIRELVAAYYNNQAWVEAQRWCSEGRRRFHADPFFIECRLWLMAAPGTPTWPPDSAWRALDDLEARTPSSEWPLASRQARMYVAGALARAGLRDSADRVLVRARSGSEIDPSRYLVGLEAMLRETALNDRDGAIRALAEYLAGNPGHRAGLARSPSWWWREMRQDPRFRDLVGLPR